jgi:AraC-like DNA-binding protein
MRFNRLQNLFFASMGHSQEFLALFEHLPGVFFFAKDAEGRFIAANNATMQRLGVMDPSKFIGTTDEDYVPDELVKDFRDDDRQVMKTGKPLLNQLEAWLDEQRELQWFLTTKLPIKGKNGRNIGVMAVIRRYEADREQYSIKEAADAVALLKANPQHVLTTGALAKAVGTSERTLHRKIYQAMGLTPYELILRIRIRAAAQKLVSTNDTISEIALNHGFCDQSAFTKHFRQRTGVTPRQFRLRHQG